MSTISSQCVDEIVERLNESSGRPTGLEPVIRGRRSWPTDDEQVAGKAWALVFSGKNALEKLDANGLTKLNLFQVKVVIMGVGDTSTPAEVVIDPVRAWCTKQLDGKRLPDLAEEVEEVEDGEVEYAVKSKNPVCRQINTFVVHHTSRIGDAELRY